MLPDMCGQLPTSRVTHFLSGSALQVHWMNLAGCTAFPFHLQLSRDKSRKVHLVSLTFQLEVSQLVHRR